MGNDPFIHMVLLEMTGHPSAPDNTLPRKKGNNNLLKTPPPVGVSGRRSEKQTLSDVLSKFVYGFVVDKNLNTIGEQTDF